MGFLEAIREKVIGVNQHDQSMKIISLLIAESGGLRGLVEKFEAEGLDEKIESWLSPNPNLPITSEQIEHVLGFVEIESLSARFGKEPYQLSALLARDLPKFIDRLSPDGNMNMIDQYKLKMDQWRHLFH